MRLKFVLFWMNEVEIPVENDDGKLERNELLNEVYSTAAMNSTGI